MLDDEAGAAGPARHGAPPQAGSRDAAPGWSTLAGLAWRRRVTIGLTALGLGAGALLLGKLAEPRFTASAQLYIDPRDIQIVDRALTAGGQDGTNNIAVVESQARVVTSTAVLLRVVQAEDLVHDPEFTRSPGLTGLLERLGLARPKPADEAGAARALEERIGVRRAERTFVVDVTVRANDADKAARLANAVAESYLAEESNARASAARKASAALSGRLAELREAVRVAEGAVEAYRARHNLIGARGQLVTEQQLADVNGQLASARARVSDAQARFDQIEAGRRSARDGGAISEAVTSQTIGALRTQHAELRRRQAELANELGPRHPQLLSVASQARDVQRSIGEEVARIAQAARADLERARGLEASIARELDALKQRSAETGQAQVQLRELEREAEASRGVYQAFLTRARETGEQEGLNTANARIITVATPPKVRSYPPRLALLVALGLLAGAGLGTGLALWPALAGAPSRPTPESPPEAPPWTPPPGRRRADDASRALSLPAPVPLTPPLPQLGHLAAAELIRHPSRTRAAGAPVDLTRIGLPVLRPSREPGGFALAIRRLRDDLLAAQAPGTPRRVALLGPDAARRRVAALNLALASARDGESVLLVDTDGALAGAVGAGERPSPGVASGHGLVRSTMNDLTVALALPAADARRRRAVLDALLRPGSGFDLAVFDGPGPAAEGGLPEADDVLLVLGPDETPDPAALPEPVRARLRGLIVADLAALPSAPALALVR